MKKFAIILPALLAGIVLSAAPARAALKVVATKGASRNCRTSHPMTT